MKNIFIFCLLISLKSLAIPASPPEPKAKAVLQEIKTVDDIKRFIYPARVEAKINSSVTADLDGHVLRILKTLGASVRAGDVVLYLENRDPAFTYSAVPVRSPITGTISSLKLQLMSKVAKGEKLFTVMNADILHINAEIPASDLPYLRPGTVGQFQISQSANPFPVRIVGLSPIIDPRTGTATAEIEFSGSEKLRGSVEKNISAVKSRFIPPVGSVGQASFQISSGEVILLPEHSLNYVEGKPTVRVIDGEHKARRRSIELGEQREDLFVVKSGLKPGEKVVVRANRSLKEGEEVEESLEGSGKGSN